VGRSAGHLCSPLALPVKQTGRCRMACPFTHVAMDSSAAPLDFMLSVTHDADVAERFVHQVLQACQTLTPRVSTIDKHAAYPLAFNTLQQDVTHS
jgi:transposase-like protein